MEGQCRGETEEEGEMECMEVKKRRGMACRRGGRLEAAGISREGRCRLCGRWEEER